MGYLYSFLKPEHEYLPHWQELRRRRWQFLISLALFLPSVALATVLTWPLRSLIGEAGASAMATLLAAVIPVWLYVRMLGWPCPRCGRRFLLARWRMTLINDQCVHCRLPKYAPTDPAKQNWEFESHD